MSIGRFLLSFFLVKKVISYFHNPLTYLNSPQIIYSLIIFFRLFDEFELQRSGLYSASGLFPQNAPVNYFASNPHHHPLANLDRLKWDFL